MSVSEFDEAIHGDYEREFDAVLTAEYPEQEQRGWSGHPAWEDDATLLAELREQDEEFAVWDEHAKWL